MIASTQVLLSFSNLMRDLLIKKLMRASAVLRVPYPVFLFTTVVQKCRAIAVLRKRHNQLYLAGRYCDFRDDRCKFTEDVSYCLGFTGLKLTLSFFPGSAIFRALSRGSLRLQHLHICSYMYMYIILPPIHCRSICSQLRFRNA